MTYEWRKSTHSDHYGSCVEVRRAPNAVRDSKNATGPTLTNVDVPALVAYARRA